MAQNRRSYHLHWVPTQKTDIALAVKYGAGEKKHVHPKPRRGGNGFERLVAVHCIEQGLSGLGAIAEALTAKCQNAKKRMQLHTDCI